MVQHLKVEYRLLYLFLVVSFTACTLSTDRHDLTYTISIDNQSSADIKGYIYRLEGLAAIDSFLIRSGEVVPFCTYWSPNWASFGCTDTDNILEFIFENGKGYRCAESPDGRNMSAFCFQNEFDPFDPPRPPTGSTNSIIVITEEDLENAFDIF